VLGQVVRLLRRSRTPALAFQKIRPALFSSLGVGAVGGGPLNEASRGVVHIGRDGVAVSPTNEEHNPQTQRGATDHLQHRRSGRA
jgi:hypothetical protein